MTNERHQSYKKVMSSLDKIAPSKLHDDEEALLRDVAEGLLLSPDDASDEADRLIKQAASQLDDLVESERWMQSSADRLLQEIEACWLQPVSA